MKTVSLTKETKLKNTTEFSLVFPKTESFLSTGFAQFSNEIYDERVLKNIGRFEKLTREHRQLHGVLDQKI